MKAIVLTKDNLRVILLGYAVFKDADKLMHWLSTPNLNLGGFTAIQLMQKNKTRKLLEFMERDVDEALKIANKVKEQAHAESEQKTQEGES